MRYLPLVLRHLRRNWLRTSSTILAMAACIFLFCTLRTLLDAVSFNLRSANDSRLITRHSVSLTFNLPLAYKERIAALPGVEAATAAVYFGGLLGNDFRNFFPNSAVEADTFFATYPEFMVPPEQYEAFRADLRGCVVGRATAERFGWKLGDTLQLESYIPPYRIGRPFDFVVRGIYDADQQRFPGTDVTTLFFHFKYLYEATRQTSGVGSYIVKISDPRQAGRISSAIDALFENSDVPTRTDTESSFRAGFISMAGNLAVLLNGVALMVMFAILLVTANAMSMSIRERKAEIAVLKTLGFPSRLVMVLVLAEGAVIGAAGGSLGLLLGTATLRRLPYLPIIGGAVRGFPNLGMTPQLAAVGLTLALLLSLAAAFVPALVAYRARIVDALRQA